MYFALRVISATIVLGIFIGASVSKKYSLYFSCFLAIAAFLLVYEKGFATEQVIASSMVVNIVLGITCGFIFSLPVFAAELISEVLSVNIDKASNKSIKTVIVLALLINLFNMDFFPYFFSILIKTRKVGPEFFQMQLIPTVNFSLSTMTKFLLPGLAVLASTFVFFALMTILLPGIVNSGIKKGVMILIILLTTLFYGQHCTSLYYDLMHIGSNG